MKNIFKIILLIFLFAFSEEDFKSAQLKYSRVRAAYSEKEKELKQLMKEKNIELNHLNIFIRVFKTEKELEVWGRSGNKGKYKLIKTYSICRTSGSVGPKRKKGDGQTPEGFYYIDRFNPSSNFHLSLGINYPNASDKILGAKDPGGDIFIHGACVTIGCIPLTDTYIKEVYLLAVEAKNNGQVKIPVHIFPYRFNKEAKITTQKDLQSFWENIKKGFDLFENNLTPPAYTILPDGKYKFN